MTERLTILALEQEGDAWGWLPCHETWGNVALKSSRNIFSPIAKGAPTVEISLRPQPLTRRNVLFWNEKFLLVTAIDRTGERHSLKVTAAVLNPVNCMLTRNRYKRNELNRLVPDGVTVFRFPCWLTEKYAGYEQKDPQALVNMTFVLLTPKEIELNSGELVTIGEKTYVVAVPHLLDEDKNEYEIYRTEEA